jgi:Leucine-rich repeat (LRR) protein
MNLRELNLNNCLHLRHILNVSGLQNLEKFSFQNCKSLITIHDSIGLLSKLKILDAKGCSKLKSFPPMKLISLEQLELSFCESLKSFPEILGAMKNMERIVLKGTSIEEFPLSFQNLTGLRTLGIWGSGKIRLPSSILMMPNLSSIYAQGCQLLPIQNSMMFSNVQKLRLIKCNIPDEFLPTLLMSFANVKYLNLLGSNFTILPECLKECRVLTSLILNCCKYLREIKAIPPSLKHMSALRCESLTSSSRSMLLNQVTFCLQTS